MTLCHGWLFLLLLHVESSPALHVLPQNIFLTDNATIKLGDFGSACVLNKYENGEADIYCLVTALMLTCYSVAVLNPTLMLMLERHIMWLQKSGTTNRTTTRGMLTSCNLFHHFTKHNIT